MSRKPPSSGADRPRGSSDAQHDTGPAPNTSSRSLAVAPRWMKTVMPLQRPTHHAGRAIGAGDLLGRLEESDPRAAKAAGLARDHDRAEVLREDGVGGAVSQAAQSFAGQRLFPDDRPGQPGAIDDRGSERCVIHGCSGVLPRRPEQRLDLGVHVGRRASSVATSAARTSPRCGGGSRRGLASGGDGQAQHHLAALDRPRGGELELARPGGVALARGLDHLGAGGRARIHRLEDRGRGRVGPQQARSACRLAPGDLGGNASVSTCEPRFCRRPWLSFSHFSRAAGRSPGRSGRWRPTGQRLAGVALQAGLHRGEVLPLALGEVGLGHGFAAPASLLAA